MKDKIKKLKSICLACDECMIVHHKDEVTLRCTEYNAEQILYKDVQLCSHFRLKRDLGSDLTSKEIKEFEEHFKPVIFED